MTASAAKLLIASVTILGFVGAASAKSVTVTPAVQDACEWDYHNLCDQYAIGSDLLDMCFKQNGPKLSKPCVDALIAAGDTSQEYVDQQKSCSANSARGRQLGGRPAFAAPAGSFARSSRCRFRA